MPRPTRRYYFEFTHPAGKTVKTYAVGTTPCNAKNNAFEQLERVIQLTPGHPTEGWQLTTQRDEGILGVVG